MGVTATVTSFPLSKHTGGGEATPAFSGWHVYVGSGPSPLSCGVFLPPPLLQAFLLMVAERVLPLLPCLAGVFICSSMGDCPSPLFGAQAYYSVFFSFFPGWGSVCPGGYADLAQGCLWEYHVLLSSPCGLRPPKLSRRWHLAAQEPSWFLHLM
jgi:hypothetical protein